MKSSVANTAFSMEGMASMAARSPCWRYDQRRCLRRAHPEGRALANPSRDFHRALAVLAVRMNLLHESHAQRLLRVELIAKEQVVHRVAPARTAEVAKVRTAKRRDPALRLELTEPCGVRRDDDVARQHHLDADGVGDAVHDGDHRLGGAPVEGERVDLILRDRLRRGGWDRKTWPCPGRRSCARPPDPGPRPIGRRRLRRSSGVWIVATSALE